LVRSRANDERARTSEIGGNSRCSEVGGALRWRYDWLSKRNMKSCHFRTPRTPAMSRSPARRPKLRTISETYASRSRELQRLRCATGSETFVVGRFRLASRARSTTGFSSSGANGTHLRQLQGDRACAVARKLTRKGWPLAANPWRALRKCNVRTGHAHSSPAETSDFLWILDSGFRRQIAGARFTAGSNS
jgi:hypothetical protein